MGNVYRYINKETNNVEYVGLVYNRPLYKRIREHATMEKWDSQKYKVEYITCTSRTDLEYLEAHFIAKFKTYKFNNSAKKNMGESELIDDSKFEWIELHPYIVDGFTVKEMAKHLASAYINKPDQEKSQYYKSITDIKGDENIKYFEEVKENMPLYVREYLFGTTSDMIEISLDYKYPVINLKYLSSFTEAFYMVDSDFVYLKNPEMIEKYEEEKVKKEEYFEYIDHIIRSFSKLQGVFG